MIQKKRLMRGTAAVLAAGMLLSSVSAAAAEGQTLERGDLNGDNCVELGDALIALRAYTEQLGSKPVTLTPEQIAAADLTETGTVDLGDAQFILSYYTMNTMGGKNMSWEQILKPFTDEKAAHAMIEKLMQAAVECDDDTYLSLTNLREFMQASEGDAFTEEKLHETLNLKGEAITEYQVGTGHRDPESLQIYNAYIQKLHAEAEQQLSSDMSEENRARVERLLAFLQPFDNLLLFDVKVTANGTVRTNTVYAVYQDGRWYMDQAIVQAMLRYVSRSNNSSANSSAKILNKAVTSALTDLDAGGADISRLAGDYCLKGSDFKDLTPVSYDSNSDAETLLRALKYQICLYADQVSEVECAAFCVNDGGGCPCAAVAVRDDLNKIWYGVYPGSPSVETNTGFRNIEEALAYGKELSGNRY